MTVKDAVLEKLDRLPIFRQQEVLDFTEFLEQKDAGGRAGPRITPKREAPPKTRIIKDPITGFPVLDSGKDAPVLTHEMIREMLSDFP